MRYHWGLGVGHLHAHRLTSASSCIPDQPMDVEASDHVPTNPEAVPANGDLNDDVATANNMCHDFADAEMVLEDRDPEGWDDVESDNSEGSSNHDNDSEGDFGEIYD